MFKYGSVCSGIEAATVAWDPLEWKAEFYSEIEKFPSAALEHHYPETPNLGDMTKFKEWKDATIDVLVGGTPCQSFSVAGLRKGLDDPRGNLMLTYLAIANRYRPKWLVWENVPGVLSSNGGRDFGTFLGALGQLGYGFAYRVLDAQYFGVAQRRRRVFVVGYLGDWQPAAAVLFEQHSLQGHSAPSREKGARPAKCLRASPHSGLREDADTLVTGNPVAAYGGGNCSGPIDRSTALTAHGTRLDFDTETFISEPIAFSGKDHGADATHNLCPTLRAGGANKSHANSGNWPAVALPIHDKTTRHAGKRGDLQDGAGNGLGVGNEKDPMFTLTKGDKHAVFVQPTADCLTSNWHNSNGAKAGNQVGMINPVITPMAVRRLTPVECERLQGFPDNYTQIPWRKKGPEDCPDGPRYKALGNSMAVPVMRWIGERIEMVDKIIR